MPVEAFGWGDAFKAFIGAFLGAGFAFASNLLMQRYLRRRDDRAAGNLAITTIARKLEDFYNIHRTLLNERHARLGDTAVRLPAWMQFRPLSYPFREDLKIDLAKLTFLFTKDHAHVVNKLMLVDSRYADLALLLRLLNEQLGQIHEKIAAQGFPAQTDLHVGNTEKLLGVLLVTNANTYAEGVIARLAVDEADYLLAEEALHGALKEQFGAKGLLRLRVDPRLKSAYSPVRSVSAADATKNATNLSQSGLP